MNVVIKSKVSMIRLAFIVHSFPYNKKRVMDRRTERRTDGQTGLLQQYLAALMLRMLTRDKSMLFLTTHGNVVSSQ